MTWMPNSRSISVGSVSATVRTPAGDARVGDHDVDRAVRGQHLVTQVPALLERLHGGLVHGGRAAPLAMALAVPSAASASRW